MRPCSVTRGPPPHCRVTPCPPHFGGSHSSRKHLYWGHQGHTQASPGPGVPAPPHPTPAPPGTPPVQDGSAGAAASSSAPRRPRLCSARPPRPPPHPHRGLRQSVTRWGPSSALGGAAGAPIPPPALHEAALLAARRPRQLQVEAGGLRGEGEWGDRGTPRGPRSPGGSPPPPRGSPGTLTDSPASSLGG